MLVLGKYQRVGERAEARAHFTEDRTCRLFASDPEISGQGLPSTLDDVVREADLAVVVRAYVPARQPRATLSQVPPSCRRLSREYPAASATGQHEAGRPCADDEAVGVAN